MPHLAIGRALAACALAAVLPAAAQTMYKWVDEKGTTHFSESPPPDGAKAKATKVEPKVIPPSNPAAAPSRDTPEAWRAQEAEFRRRQLERGQREKAEGREKAERAYECNRARQRLTTLTNTHRIYRDNADGTRTFMSDSERQDAMARQRDVIKENCD
jgi:Domain of unknown function (DUF4124)